MKAVREDIRSFVCVIFHIRWFE